MNDMMPRLAINLVIDCKTFTAKELISHFDSLRYNKVIYTEVLLKNLTTVDEFKDLSAAFKLMRSSKHIDYTLWLEDIEDRTVLIDLLTKCVAIDRYVMGIVTTKTDNTEDVRFIVKSEHHFPASQSRDFSEYSHSLMIAHEPEKVLKHSVANIDYICAPEGMQRGLRRVIDDYVKLYSNRKSNSDLETSYDESQSLEEAQ